MNALLFRSLTGLVGSAVLLAASARIAHAAAPSPTPARAGARLHARSRLDLAALPASAFPGASVDQGYGTQSDVAGAGPGIVATYERTFTYPSATNPPYAFVDEELFAAGDQSAAAKRFTKL